MPSSSKKPKPKASSSERVARQTAEPIVVEDLDEENSQEEMKIPTGMPLEPWHRSPSPFESWSDQEDTSWGLKIVSEEVDGWGNVRHETQWDGWGRQDGTNTTWKDEYIDDELRVRLEVTKPWDKREMRRRRRMANESRDLELSTGVDIHNNCTRYRAQAYDEKKAMVLDLKDSFSAFYLKAKRREPSLLDENLDKEIEVQEGDARRSQRQRKRAAKAISSSVSSSRAPSSKTLSASASQSQTRASSSATATTMRPTPTPSTISSLTSISERSTPSNHRLLTPAASSVTLVSASPASSSRRSFSHIPAGPPMSEKARGKQPMRSETIPPPSPLPSRPNGFSRRRALAEEWSLWGAPISIRNDVDDEDIPPLPRDFEWIEKGYQYDTGLDYLDSDKGFLMGCSGHRSCSTKAIGRCDCQGESSCLDPSGRKICAYDSKGLYKFNVLRGVEVLECTPNCECSDDCPNRVLQRQRDISLEVFKTPQRGWGVRAMEMVERGKVLGMYTGLLIRREDASDKMDYCFDLDGQENLDDDDSDAGIGDRYSVDSESKGNWTRFINHSCDPNLAIYEVVYDLPPGQGTPYLAYAAIRDIPAGEEFTFNYNPNIEEIVQSAKKSKKFKTTNGKRIPAGRKECHCAAQNCRGYF